MDNVKASQMMTLNVYYVVGGLALLTMCVKGNIKRGEFNKSMSSSQCALMEMGQAEA